MRSFLVVEVVFSALLALRSPWYAFFTWIGFLHAYGFLKGAWRWAVSAVVAIFFSVAQAGGFHRPTVPLVAIWVLLACVDVGLIGVFIRLGVKTEEHNLARKGMIAELADANHRLEEMIAENTGLQAQLLIQAREAGAGDERQRMAREIHDTLAQGLTGIVTQLEAAQQTSHDAERERRIDNAKRLARDSLAEARRSVQALRPQALENSRLPEALADEVARWSVTSGVTGEVETTGEARAARHLRGQRRVRGGGGGVQRTGGGRPGRGAEPGRSADGLADAGPRRGQRDQGAGGEGHRRAGAGAHHLRHRHRRGARDRGRRHRLPAQGLPARRTAARRPRRGPRRGGAVALGRHPSPRPGQAARQGTAQPARTRRPGADRAGLLQPRGRRPPV